MQQKVLNAIQPWDATRFLTLTLKATGAALTDRFATLFSAFERLRKSDVWQDNVRGGIAIPEVTIGKHGQWHTHLHILVNGRFIPHAQLKQAWYEATGDSFIVDVQAVHSRTDAASYVAGYVAKPADMAAWPGEKIREFATATHGMRFMRSYGNARLPAEAEADDGLDTPAGSTHLCDVNAVLRAERDSEHVRHAVDILARCGGTLAKVLDRDEPAPGGPPVDQRELEFAAAVAAIINAAFPKPPDPADLEAQRRHSFSLPPAPLAYVRKCEQLAFDILRPTRKL